MSDMMLNCFDLCQKQIVCREKEKLVLGLICVVQVSDTREIKHTGRMSYEQFERRARRANGVKKA